MARKAARPALYELMGGSPRNRPPAGRAARAEIPRPPAAAVDGETDAEAEAPPPAESHETGSRRAAPFLWFGGIAAAAVALVAFSYGHLLGSRSEQQDQDREWLALHGPTLPVPDPEPGPEEAGDRRPPAQATNSLPTPAQGPIVSDPRLGGLNYFVLAYTQHDNAVKLSRFFRERGVEAYAVKDKNGSAYRVIALPGYARGERGSSPVRDLESRIAAAARKWKLEVNSRDDLTYYPERYGGQEK